MARRDAQTASRWPPTFFVDNFRGQDLYQRFGGGPTTGYGDTPVTVRIYEIG